MSVIQLAAISGSLRKDSFNTMLLHNLKDLLPEGMIMQTVAIDQLPLYNADLDLPAATERPTTVVELRKQLTLAKGIIIISPEYNYSIPGGLKNAIDWASRGEDSPLRKKHIALMGVTPGLWGTIRMQAAFHPVFQFLDMKPVYQPEVLVSRAKDKFDGDGKLTDETTKDLIRKKLKALANIIRAEQ